MARMVRKRGKSNLSGTAGTVEFFTINGETYFKAHAKKHKKSKSEKAVRGRSNFSAVVTMAKEINKVVVLKELWSHSKLEGRNGYQKLIKYNMPFVHEGNLTIKNFFTPKGRELSIKEFLIEGDLVSFTMDVYGFIKPPIILHLYYYWYNPKEGSVNETAIIYTHIEISQDDADEMRNKGESKYSIMFRLGAIKPQFQSFKDVVILLAVTGVPSIAGRRYWTNTVGFDIPLV
ncbi:MAG: hypothetical protein P4L35_01565 [Ignavibacteriaceae bacterium]|nr:hypothetical protein [Ignavibacteriaceae bacterium]